MLLFSRFPAARGALLLLCALAASLVSACTEDGPTDPTKLVASLQPLYGELHFSAGQHGFVWVRVVDAGLQPLGGVPVTWESPLGGVLDSTTSTSDMSGVATIGWTAPSTLGEFSIVAHVGKIQSPVLPMYVVPSNATRFEFLPDSVHFTAQHQSRLLRIVGHDQFGYVTRNFEVGAPVQSWDGDTAVVQLTSGGGAGIRYLVVTAWPGARDSVALIQQPVLASITAIAGVDTVNGLAVGQRAALQLTGLDSLGYSFTGTSTTVPVQVTSSDPSVVSVASDGSLTGVASGSATIDVTAGGATYHATFPVFPPFDVGTERPSVGLISDEYINTNGVFLTDDGTLYETVYRIIHGMGTITSDEVLTAHAGAATWSRTVLPYAPIVVNPAGPLYIANESDRSLHAVGTGGVDRWTYDYSPLTTASCRFSGWKDGVIAGCDTLLFAVRSDGTLAFTRTVRTPARQFLDTPNLTFARTADSVSAFAPDGSLRWTISTAASAAMADAAGNLYLIESGVRMVDASGATRWQNPTPLAGCILATADRIVVCRNGSTITALANADGHQLWSISRATNDLAAISGDAVVTTGAYPGAYLWKLDARTGALLGRSLTRVDASTLLVAHGSLGAYRLSPYSVTYAHLFTAPFGPGSDWAQQGGNAGRSGQVTP